MDRGADPTWQPTAGKPPDKLWLRGQEHTTVITIYYSTIDTVVLEAVTVLLPFPATDLGEAGFSFCFLSHLLWQNTQTMEFASSIILRTLFSGCERRISSLPRPALVSRHH